MGAPGAPGAPGASGADQHVPVASSRSGAGGHQWSLLIMGLSG